MPTMLVEIAVSRCPPASGVLLATGCASTSTSPGPAGLARLPRPSFSSWVQHLRLPEPPQTKQAKIVVICGQKSQTAPESGARECATIGNYSDPGCGHRLCLGLR